MTPSPTDASRWFPPRIRMEHLWLGLPVAIVLWKGFVFPLPLLDFWWHLKLGEVIVTTGSIPRTDIFSFTAQGNIFVAQNWLAEVIYYLVYRAGGFPLLVGMNAGLLLLTLVPVYLLCRREAVSIRPAAFAACLFALCLFGNIRPQVFSFALFSLYLLVLWEYRRRRMNLLWTLPCLMVLWVNLHGAFVLGLGLIALFITTETVHSFLAAPGKEKLEARKLLLLIIILFVTLAATLVNPEAHRVYEYVRAVMADPVSQGQVTEWQPPDIRTATGRLLFYGPFFFTLFVMMVTRGRPNATEFGLFLAFSAFAMTALRNSMWFLIVATPILARSLATIDWKSLRDALERSSRLGALLAKSTHHSNASRAPHFRFNFMLAAAAVVYTILVSPWIRPALYGTSLLDSQTPVGAMNYIASHDLRGNIFHPQVYGDYLIWRLWPDHRSFFDGRVHVFGEELVRSYNRTFEEGGWEETLSKFDIRFLLLDKDESRESLIDSIRLSRGWMLMYEDDLSAVFQRTKETLGGDSNP